MLVMGALKKKASKYVTKCELYFTALWLRYYLILQQMILHHQKKIESKRERKIVSSFSKSEVN